jgi:hypothetical protein
MANVNVALKTETVLDISDGTGPEGEEGYQLIVGQTWNSYFIPKDQADDIARFILFGELPPDPQPEPQPEPEPTPEEAPE